MLNRRELLRSTAAGAAALALPTFARAQEGKAFTLPKLPYAFDALEPHIDARTMEIHHGRHHQLFVDNLNKLLAKSDMLGKPVVDVARNYKTLPADLQTPIRNNAGGHLNHSWFWQMMAPKSAGPKGELLKAIDASFGTLDGFKKEFAAAAMGRFGSGWAWLVKGKEKPLAIISTANQDNPVMEGYSAVLGCDVWEHAYYLKYQNKRADYVNAWFNVANWEFAAELFAAK